jgi:ribosomal protein L40E
MEPLSGLDGDVIVRIVMFVGFILVMARRLQQQVTNATKRFAPQKESVPSLERCSNCGQLNTPQATTCKHCGVSLQQSSGTLAKGVDDRSVPPLVKQV